MADTPAPARRLRLILTAAAVPVLTAVVMLLSGYGAKPGQDAPSRTGHHQQPAAAGSQPGTGKPAQPMTVQELATVLGCQAKLDGRAADFRKAQCTTAGSTIVLLDFDTTEGMRAWLDGARDYGGVYLVGERWALAGNSKEYLRAVQVTLGGTVEEGAAH